jgi:hypothetical protein
MVGWSQMDLAMSRGRPAATHAGTQRQAGSAAVWKAAFTHACQSMPHTQGIHTTEHRQGRRTSATGRQIAALAPAARDVAGRRGEPPAGLLFAGGLLLPFRLLGLQREETGGRKTAAESVSALRVPQLGLAWPLQPRPACSKPLTHLLALLLLGLDPLKGICGGGRWEEVVEAAELGSRSPQAA